MTARFNPPPNWPPPPAGWTPPPDWQPDPAWGPAPQGWQFWVEESPPSGFGSGYGGKQPGVPGAGPSPGAAPYAQGAPYGQATPYAAPQGEPAGQHPRPNRDAWKRAALVALGLFAVFGTLAAVLALDDAAYAAGRVFGVALLAFIVTAVAARLSASRWGWARYLAVLLPVYLVMSVLSALGSRS